MKVNVFIVALAAISSSYVFVSCSDEQNDFNDDKTAITKKSNSSLMDSFYNDDFLEVMSDSQSFAEYLKLVSDEFGIDMQGLSSSNAILALDSLALDACFLDMIENNLVPETTTSRLEEINSLLQTANVEKDSAMVCSLIVESYNLMHCKPVSMSEYENMYNNRMLDPFIAERVLERLQKEYPVLKNYDEEELCFVLTVASLYRQYSMDIDSKVAPVPCKQRCKNAQDRAVKRAYINYTCRLFECCALGGPWGAALCGAVASYILYTDMDDIMQTYNDCVAGCKK